MRSIISHVTDFLLNKYIVAALAFFIWILCFDRYSIRTQFSLSKTINQLEDRKIELQEQIEETKLIRAELDQNMELYAREKYLMKKPNEEIYLLVD